MAAARSPRVLLVEDEAPIRELLARVLLRQGCDVIVAAEGSEATVLADDVLASIDLMVTDLIMPGPNGADVAMRLRERVPELNVLFMSGSADRPVLERVVSAGERFIDKPFSVARFREVVRTALGRDGARH